MLKPKRQRYYNTEKNRRRGQRAAASLDAYSASDQEYFGPRYVGNGSNDECLTDFLCDLQHWARQNKINFGECLRRGNQHFEVEATDRKGDK